MSLLLRNVCPWGAPPVDLRIAGGTIAAEATFQAGDDVIDGRGGLLLPGLHDHHLHILALAARRASVDLAGALDEGTVRARLAAAPAGICVRGVDYDERAAGLPDAAMLDRWLPARPLRLADRTGALRVLNSAAMALLGDRPLPAGAERDAGGRPTGRFWREDHWLAQALPQALPDLAGLGAELAAFGLTALTDAGAHNGPSEAALLSGALPQRLTLMGSEALEPGAGYRLGALKLLIDERDLPPLDALAARIAGARAVDRPVAAHCVTEAELALYLAALDMAGGARAGDRIEHGGMIPAAFIGEIARAGLIVATNPAFIHDRGDRYRVTVEPDRRDDLYRAASLHGAGIELLGGSDAPYAAVDPWLALRTARDRRTASGALLGEGERLPALLALRLFARGSLSPGQPADLVLCEGGPADVLADLDAARVRLTMIDGFPVHRRD
ncbi:amidohydrolase family protein [Novosphingobium sp. KCTC 2891]|uniref:amidohydrolase family protein n=1 Tax=Novosphingobium sp. KCTC 2891 TaxID=2989730 RepID=UPI0022221472|nr:amidohydrolase family protein [Novosphingobium sp. KCTC 2891]MCW1383654.1 amidohydrolase family protein [Novosphingobium sp. KCTC 2891]